MKLATLVTNTDFSDFARARPLDDAKFARLLAEVRPGWQVDAYWVCKGAFPKEITRYDGVLVTGSPASVMDKADWIQQLRDLVPRIIAARVPLFGACFGHQIIAQALGAGIIRNPAGWGHALLPLDRTGRAAWSGTGQRLWLYGSHIEQVAALPVGADRLFESPGCPIAGFAIKNRVFTVQHHPEMSASFFADLLDAYADHVGPEVTAAARRSMQDRVADREAFGHEIAAFFEQARL